MTQVKLKVSRQLVYKYRDDLINVFKSKSFFFIATTYDIFQKKNPIFNYVRLQNRHINKQTNKNITSMKLY